MKRLVGLFVSVVLMVFLFGCGGGGGDDDGGGGGSARLPGEVTSIEAQPGAPKFSGYDLQFKQGDYWLYNWKNVDCSIGQGAYKTYGCTTQTGAFRITLDQPRTIMGITFFKVISERGGAIYYANLPWQYVASFNNKIYGFKDDHVYLVFDAQNGSWMGGTFFWGPSGTDIFSIKVSNDIHEVDYMVSDDFDITEYHKPLVGPYGYKEDLTSYALGFYYHSVETLTLSESSKNN